MRRTGESELISQRYSPMLHTLPLFRGVEIEDFPALLLCLRGEIRYYDRGEYILREGERAEHLCVMLEGTAQLQQEDYQGNRSLLRSLDPGALFAEAFACLGMPLPVSALAVSDCTVLLLSAERLFRDPRPCEFHHLLLRNLLTLMAEQNVFLRRRLGNTVRKTTREKLLSYLSDESRRQGRRSFTIPFDRQALADYLGVDRSAMSAELSRLQKEGYLITRRQEFTLLWEEGE